MSKLKYLTLAGALAFGLSSCNDWLDVNTDPDNPNDQTALIQNQLPWFQHFYQYSAGITNVRTSMTAGVLYSNAGTNNAGGVTWDFSTGSWTTGSYQSWYVYANSINDAYKKAEAQGAYDYMGAIDVVYAMGFMEMLDLYGEIPFTQAFNPSNVSPAYDNGKTIFYGCIDKLNEAIALFQKTQEAGATSLSTGDYWNGGDVSKWIKMCYGLKARYLLKLSKKADLFQPDSILDCLAKGPQSNDDNVVAACYNKTGDVTDWFYGDYIGTNCNWDYGAYGNNQRISQYYYNLLTDMRGSGVQDPRFTKIVPASMCDVKFDANGKAVSYDWLRSKGVDIHGEAKRLSVGGPTSIIIPNYAGTDQIIHYAIADADARAAFIKSLEGVHAYTISDDTVSVTYQKGSLYCNTPDYHYAGDTAYVNLRQNSLGTADGSSTPASNDVNWYFQSLPAFQAGVVGSTGSYQLRPVSDQELLTYAEMCFIKAEVLFRQGKSGAALTAYRDGIQAHLDQMQAKLIQWQGEGYDNPDMMPMDQAAISAYMNSKAVCQSAGELTMSDIMLQKYITMGCSIENWNDMRRFNYSAGNVGGFGVVYPGFDRSPLFTGASKLSGASKTDVNYWPRRWRLPYNIELNYNSNNALAANAHAADQDVWGIPVWWDCATDQDYFNAVGVQGK
jgi:hypothetical protein